MDYIKTWKEVILKPSDFYRRMPTTGGYTEPLTFAAISNIIFWFLIVLYSVSKLTMHSSRFSFFFLLGSTSVIMGLGLIIIFIIFFILAFIANLLYKAFGGTGSYEGTVRFWLYANATLVLSWIPYIGNIAIIYGIYLLIVGGMIVHNVSMKKSAIAVFLIFVLPAVLFVWRQATLSSLIH